MDTGKTARSPAMNVYQVDLRPVLHFKQRVCIDLNPSSGKAGLLSSLAFCSPERPFTHPAPVGHPSQEAGLLSSRLFAYSKAGRPTPPRGARHPSEEGILHGCSMQQPKVPSSEGCPDARRGGVGLPAFEQAIV